MWLKMLKSYFVHQSAQDAEEISNAVFNLEDFENMVGAQSYFQKKIGSTEACLTPEIVVEILSEGRITEEQRQHLDICSDCSALYKKVKDSINNVPSSLQLVDKVDKAIYND